MTDQADLLPGTLDLLILKAVSLGALHGYGVLLRIEQITSGALLVEQGALYPALYRLEHQGLLDTEWGTSDNNRRAKFYRLTAAGRRRLREETDELEPSRGRDGRRAEGAAVGRLRAMVSNVASAASESRERSGAKGPRERACKGVRGTKSPGK